MWFVTWNVGFTPAVNGGTLSLSQVASSPYCRSSVVDLVGVTFDQSVEKLRGSVRAQPITPMDSELAIPLVARAHVVTTNNV